LIIHKGHEKKKKMLGRPLLRLRHLLVPAENAPSSSGWHNNVVLLLNLMMSFLCTVFSWAFPSYALKFDSPFFFFKNLFGC
jgi:hypothetical protein